MTGWHITPPHDHHHADICVSKLGHIQIMMVQIMVHMSCPLFGVKSLPEAILTYHWLDHLKQTSATFNPKSNNFHPQKCICRVEIGGHFVSATMCWHCHVVWKRQAHLVFAYLAHCVSNRFQMLFGFRLYDTARKNIRSRENKPQNFAKLELLDNKLNFQEQITKC